MRDFTHYPSHPQKPKSSSLFRSKIQVPGTDRYANSRGGSPTRNETGFVKDFSRTPLHAPAVEAMQAKLMIGQTGDIYEDEADRVSDQVMSAPHLDTVEVGEQTERVQTKHTSGGLGQTTAPPIVHEVLSSPGQLLETPSRLFMESRFGHDFSKLRVHTDEKAAESAQAIGAAAYTMGNHLVFGAGEFRPGNREGRQLLAHELTHVIQQSKGSRHIQQQPARKGKVVRVEREGKYSRKPPGPGAYTVEELTEWYSTHPDARKRTVGLVDGKRTKDYEYSVKGLWKKRFFYAITHVLADHAVEIWVNDSGDGEVVGVRREL